jgi:hypothetical protein
MPGIQLFSSPALSHPHPLAALFNAVQHRDMKFIHDMAAHLAKQDQFNNVCKYTDLLYTNILKHLISHSLIK